MKNLLIFLGGVAVGIVSTALYVKKKVVPDLVEEIERKNGEAASDYAEYWADSDEQTADEEKYEYVTVQNGPTEANKTNSKNRKASTMDYTQFSKEPTEGKTNEPMKVEPEEPPAAGTEPYLIDASEFDTYSSYQAHRFVMYSDGVVIDDETDEELDGDPKLIFGATAIDALKKDNVVFVRDDSKKQDYCVERRDIPFDGPDYPDPEDDWRS